MSATAASLVDALRRTVGQVAAPAQPDTTAHAAQDESGNSDAVSSADKAVSALRDLAKWLLAIFAAIAAILTAGIQLSSIGHLDTSDSRFKIAFVAVALTLVSVGGILVFVVRVLTSGYMTLNRIARAEEKHSDRHLMSFIRDAGYLEAGYPTVHTMRKRYRAEYAAPGSIPVDTVVDSMLAGANFYMVRRRFMQAVIAMLIFAALAATGITAFAWAANPPTAKTGLFQAPAEAFVSLSDSGKTMLASTLGKDCVTAPVHVIILGSTDTSVDVISIPTDDRRCKAGEFTIGTGPMGVSGFIAPAIGVPVPTNLAGTLSPVPTTASGTATTVGSASPVASGTPPGTRP